MLHTRKTPWAYAKSTASLSVALVDTDVINSRVVFSCGDAIISSRIKLSSSFPKHLIPLDTTSESVMYAWKKNFFQRKTLNRTYFRALIKEQSTKNPINWVIIFIADFSAVFTNCKHFKQLITIIITLQFCSACARVVLGRFIFSHPWVVWLPTRTSLAANQLYVPRTF